MAEVTRVVKDEWFPGAVDNLTMIIGLVNVAATGDTWTHGLRSTMAYGWNLAAAAEVTDIVGDANIATITAGGAVNNLKVWALGYA